MSTDTAIAPAEQPVVPISDEALRVLRQLSRRLRSLEPGRAHDRFVHVHRVLERLIPVVDALAIELYQDDQVLAPYSVEDGHVEPPDITAMREGSPGAWVREHRRSYLFSQDNGGLLHGALPFGTDSRPSQDAVLVPLLGADGVLRGALGIHSMQPGVYGPTQVRIIEMVGRILGTELGRDSEETTDAGLYEEFPELAPDAADPSDTLHEAVSLLDRLRSELELLEESMPPAPAAAGDEPQSGAVARVRRASALAEGATARLMDLAAGGLPARQAPAPVLTPREADVARLIVCDQASNAEIAHRLFISEKTVKTHVGSILRKCGQTQRSGIALVLDADALAEAVSAENPAAEAPGAQD